MEGKYRVSLARAICYTPLQSQAQFHDLRSRFKGFSGPVGSGKSKALCYEAIRLSYVNRGLVGLLGAPTYRMLKDTTLTAILGILGEHDVPIKFNRADHTIIFEETQSTILLRSLTDSDALRGTNLSWFGVDELTYANESSWLQLAARLRDPKASAYCGFGVWTPKGADWVYRRFIAEANPEYRIVTARPFENEFVLDRNPRYYDLLKGSYCDAEYRQEALGEYLTNSHNKVYSSFDPEVHLTSTQRNYALPLLWAFDFNVDPMCSVVVQKDGEGVKVLDEIVLRRSGTEEMCLEFANRYGDHLMPVKIYGDASGNARSTKGSSDYDIARATLARKLASPFTFAVPKQNPRVRDRVALVNALFMDASGSVRLRIDRKCKELTRDFEELRFKENSSVLDKTSDSDRSHLSDALGYLIWQEYARSRPRGEQNHRLL